MPGLSLRRRFLAAVIACSLTSLHAAPPVFAQSKKELREARKKFQQATELEQARNWSGALALFREVGQVKMTPQVRYHIAYCQENLGKLVSALGGYEIALSTASQLGPAFEKEVKERSEALKARIPKLTIKRGKGAAAAKIELDGVPLGTTVTGVPIDPGAHIVEATAPGYQSFNTTITVEEGSEKTLDLELEKFPADTPPPGELAGEPKKVETVKEEPSLVAPIVIGGLGVASLAASGVFFILRNGAISDLEDACGPQRDQCPASMESTYDDAKTYNLVSQVTLGAGIVGVGVAATLLLTQGGGKDPQKEEASFVVAPSAPGAAAGLSVLGRF